MLETGRCICLCSHLCGILGADWKREGCIVVTNRSPDGLTGCVEAIGSAVEDREVSWEE